MNQLDQLLNAWADTRQISPIQASAIRQEIVGTVEMPSRKWWTELFASVTTSANFSYVTWPATSRPAGLESRG